MTSGAVHTIAGDDLAVLEARAADLARPVDDDRTHDVVEVISFGVGGHDYAVPVPGVREVQRLHVVVRVPQSPPSLLGVTRVRSTILPVFDLAMLLGVGAAAPSAEMKWVLVLDASDRAPLAVAADWVDGVRPQATAEIFARDADQHPGSLGITPAGVIVLDTSALLEIPPVFGEPATDEQSGPGTQS